MTDETMTAEFQRAVGRMVDREVHYCVSHLMSELLPAIQLGGVATEYEDEAYLLFNGRTRWVPYDNGGECDEEFDTEEAAEEWIAESVRRGDIRNEEAWQIDERQDEVYEHWIVSRWLKEKLEEKGELVADILGCDIWGRTTTGQAILLDGVIQEIYREMRDWSAEQ